MAARKADDQRLLDIATPSRLAAKVFPFLYGDTFDFASWIRYAEARILRAMASPEQTFILLNVPPRHGKTVYSGVFLPAWFLGLNPTKRVIFGSYGDEYSVRYGRTVRSIVDKWGPSLFGRGVDKSAQSASDWQMAGTLGGMLSTGAGGVLTGFGGDLIVIDDLIKGPEEARSEATKKKHIDWYWEALRTRLHPGGTIVITNTRWADDDLPGHLIELQRQVGYEGDHYEIISFPALAEPAEDEQFDDEDAWRDILGRRIGEALAPGRWPQHVLEQIRAGFTGRGDLSGWYSLYQQRPTVPAGGMFPRATWMYWNVATLPTITRKVRVWDLAASAESGDWTVGVLLGASSAGDIFVLERERFKRASYETEQAVKAAASRDGYNVPVVIEQEKAGAGKTVLEHYQRELRGHTVLPGKLDGTKEERATPYSSMQQQRRIWLPEGAEWLTEWRDEHKAMIGDGRRGRHDDQIDAAAFGVRHLLEFGQTTIHIPGEMQAMIAAGRGGSLLAVPELATLEAEMRALRGEAFLDAFLSAA